MVCDAYNFGQFVAQ